MNSILSHKFRCKWLTEIKNYLATSEIIFSLLYLFSCNTVVSYLYGVLQTLLGEFLRPVTGLLFIVR